MSGDQDKITALAAERIGLDGSFVGAVKEYTTFWSGCEDLQLLPSSLQSPAAAEICRYREMPVEQLQQGFGSRSEAEVGLEEKLGGGLFARLVVRVRRHGDKQASSTDETTGSAEMLPGQFNPYPAISQDSRTNVVTIVKPWTHVAWTIEQAFADARGVSAAIFGRGLLREPVRNLLRKERSGWKAAPLGAYDPSGRRAVWRSRKAHQKRRGAIGPVPG